MRHAAADLVFVALKCVSERHALGLGARRENASIRFGLDHECLGLGLSVCAETFVLQ